MNSVLGKNLEDAGHHCTELESQRSAPHVQGESLEELRKLHDHHAELECQRSAAFGETKESGSSALPPAVPPSAAYREQYDHSGRGMRPWALG